MAIPIINSPAKQIAIKSLMGYWKYKRSIKLVIEWNKANTPKHKANIMFKSPSNVLYGIYIVYIPI